MTTRSVRRPGSIRWAIRDREVDLAGVPLLAAVVNATPDSFSDSPRERGPAAAIRRVDESLDAGADIVEVGGESNVSNRPAVGAEEEIARVVPVVESAIERGAVVSIDTYKPEVAATAIEAGAAIVNDISGFADPAMVELCAGTGVGVVLMHTTTPPKQVRWEPGGYPGGVVAEVRAWLESSVGELVAGGVAPEAIVLDPGVDFGKTPRQSIELLAGLGALNELGRPLMSAVSRKDFIGAITDRAPRERLPGTLAAVGWAIAEGASVIRSHDIAETRDFIQVVAALCGWIEVRDELRIPEDLRREPTLGDGTPG